MVSAWNISQVEVYVISGSWPGEEDVEHFWSVHLTVPGVIADSQPWRGGGDFSLDRKTSANARN